jgi:sugar phosphate isomerase/epimerase
MNDIARYIDKGFSLFPLHCSRGKSCSCGDSECGSIAKHPLTQDGFKSATNDRAQLAEWWGKYPGCNWGIATHASGLTVVDVDLMETIGSLCMDVPELMNTPRVKTANGAHFYTRRPHGWTPVQQKVGFIEHCDITNYVVAPPSIHASGHVYQWEVELDHDLIELPAWFRQYLDEATQEKEKDRAQWTFEGKRVLQGGRNKYLASRAGAMRRIGLSPGQISSALEKVYEEECVHIPPIKQAEIGKIGWSMGKYDPAKAPVIEQNEGNRLILDWGSDVSNDEKKVEWLWQDMVPRGFVTVFAGDGEMGKSWMAYSIAGRLTADKKLPGGGTEITKPEKVLVLDAENTRGVVFDRLAMSGANIDHCAVVRGVAIDDPDNPEDVSLKNIKAIKEAVEQNDFKLIIIDPVLSFAVDANSNSDQEVRNMLRPYMSLARERNIAIVLVIHLNKVDSKDIRRRVQGAPAWINVPRSALYFGPKADDTEVRLVKLFKGNLVMNKPCYEYALVKDQGIEFGAEIDVTVENLMEGETTKTDQVAQILRDAVKRGGCPSRDIQAEAATAGGSRGLFYKVLADLKGEGVLKSVKEGGEWWIRPAVDADEDLRPLWFT